MNSPKRSKFLLIFGVAWLILSLPFVLLGVVFIKQEQRFAAEGIAVHGQLVNKTMELRQERDSETKRVKTIRSFYAHYTFTTQDGQTLNSKDSVDEQVWNGMTEGAQIEVQYLPQEATTNRISRESSIIGGVLMCCFGGLGMLVGAVSLYIDLSGRLFASRLLRHGVLAEGKITRVAPSGLMVNNVPQWVIEYIYSDLQGNKHTGKSATMPPEYASQWKEGATGKVRFDGNRSHQSIWLGSMTS